MRRSICWIRPRIFCRKMSPSRLSASYWTSAAGTLRRLEVLERFQYIVTVAGGINLAEDTSNLARFVYDERRAFDSPRLSAIHILFLPHAIHFGDFMVGIGEQREIEIVFLGEFL